MPVAASFEITVLARPSETSTGKQPICKPLRHIPQGPNLMGELPWTCVGLDWT